jgi:signal transduction histidine kinase
MTSPASNDRDAVVSEAVAVFSDRLRTPLTAITAQVAMLLDGDYGSLSGEQRNALELVQRSSARLLHDDRRRGAVSCTRRSRHSHLTIKP